jgi:phospholipase/lecithinase/hemolysin
MHQFKDYSAVLLSAIVSVALAGCGGGGSDLPAKPKFTSQVSFGDSLSDVGSYNVGLVKYLHGGQFTINIPNTATNWTEQTAKALGLKAPCAAETGLDNGLGTPDTPTSTVITVADHPDCTGYAQGGARVSIPVGVGNKNVPVTPPDVPGFALTVPVITQVSHHLANTVVAPGNKFTGSELVLVMAGANDVFFQAQMVGASYSSASAVAAVQTAASQLATEVKDQIVANGAKFIVVANIPDIANTPYVTSLAEPYKTPTSHLVDLLVTSFNAQLKADLPDTSNVLNVDAYSASKDEVANPSKYVLTNVTGTACNITPGAPPVNPFATATKPGSSLACTPTNLNTGVSPADHYLFADLVHPTPYGHALFATYVLQAMVNKGWY